MSQLSTPIRLTTFKMGRPIHEDIDDSSVILHRLAEIEFNGRHQRYNRGANLLNQEADTLCVGLGESDWVLAKFSYDMSECWYSVGDKMQEGTAEFVFQEWEAFPNKYLIPRPMAEQLVKKWCEAGRLGEDIEWEHVVHWRMRPTESR